MTGAAARLSAATLRRRLALLILALASFTTALVTTTLFISPSAAATTTQTASCLDGGGVRWYSRAVWGSTYTASDGVLRVAMDYAGWTTRRSGIVPTDSVVRTYNGSGSLHNTLSWTGTFDYQSGAAYKVRNPFNPASSPGKARVTITLGVDGDGYGSCTVTFTQPSTTGAPSPTPTPTPTPTQPGGSASDTYEADVFAQTNVERTSRGLVALSTQACVDRYAEAQAARMAAESRMYHQDLSPILSDCGLRMVGENVAYGYPDGKAVMGGWMNSDGHRANILNANYRLLGVGAAQNSSGRWYAAQVFGTSR